MTTYGAEKTSIRNSIMIVALIGAFGVLFIALSQPAWRGQEMVAELKSDCSKVGGVMLEHQKMFGTTYECAGRLDR